MGDTPQYQLTVIYKGMVVALDTNLLTVTPLPRASPVTRGWIRAIQADPKSKQHLKLDWSDTSYGSGKTGK